MRFSPSLDLARLAASFEGSETLPYLTHERKRLLHFDFVCATIGCLPDA